MIAWIGTVSSILGSFLVAMGIFSAGYVSFLVGSASWLWIAWKRRDRALGVLNATFLLANLIGVWNFVI
jgi:hypothetical protein